MKRIHPVVWRVAICGVVGAAIALASAATPVNNALPGAPGGGVPRQNLATTATASAPASQPSAVTEAQFLKVMTDRCTRCHRNCATVAGIQRVPNWLVPGKPETSKIYTCLGVTRQRGAHYHDVNDKEKQIIRDFVKGLPLGN